MATVSINSFYLPGSKPEVIEAHKSVTSKFNLKVNYYEEYDRHGSWMDRILRNSTADIVGFLDIDCIPLTKEAVPEIVKFVGLNKSIAGCAQVSNHIPTMSHIFVGACCFFIWRPLYVALGSPSMLETQRSDVCEEVCYIAEENGVRMKALYPSHFEREPQEGVWRLHNYGFYGVGTTFQNKFYHLYQSRFKSNVDLFVQRANDVVQDKFSTEGMHSSTDFNYAGNICNFDIEKQMHSRVKDAI